jgi:hypothetical protein
MMFVMTVFDLQIKYMWILKTKQSRGSYFTGFIGALFGTVFGIAYGWLFILGYYASL